jgi:hypothetical protein
MVKLTKNFLALKLYFRKSCEDSCFKNSVFYGEKHVFFKIFFFGRFSVAFARIRQPYGRQIFPANHFFLRPVLSYFAEFSASWQEWQTEWLGGGGGGPQTLLPTGQKFGQITQTRMNKKMIGRENLAAIRPPLLDKSGPKKYCMKNMNFPMVYWLL